jgi:hypothetical protein
MVVGMFQLTDETFPVFKKHSGLLHALTMLRVSFLDPNNILDDEYLPMFHDVMENSEVKMDLATTYSIKKQMAKKQEISNVKNK